MTPQEARKLLGGYATGTLTHAEQEALFAAALEDQELFDDLAREQSLRDLLADPAAKASLLAALDEPRRRWWQSWRPWAAVAAMAGVATLAVSLRKPPAAPVEIARVEPPAPKVSMSAPAQEPPAAAPVVVRKRIAAPVAARPLPAPDAPAAEMAKNEAKAVGGVVGGVPPSAPPPPPPKAEAPADQVQVTAASPRMAFQDSAAVRLQSMALRTGAAPLTLRYTILRDDNGVRVRFTSGVNGYLSVGGATPVALVMMQPYTTSALTGDDVKVVFARLPVPDAPSGIAPEVQERDGETYVTNSSQNEPLVFTISLKQP